ncbi:MAG: hypothetical protein NZ942_01345 [Candidatus Aenigmarchaeota archaeon]|nr:hypothetical protein [Candidatus Aenigmarchaeota archaeon]
MFYTYTELKKRVKNISEVNQVLLQMQEEDYVLWAEIKKAAPKVAKGLLYMKPSIIVEKASLPRGVYPANILSPMVYLRILLNRDAQPEYFQKFHNKLKDFFTKNKTKISKKFLIDILIKKSYSWGHELYCKGKIPKLIHDMTRGLPREISTEDITVEIQKTEEKIKIYQDKLVILKKMFELLHKIESYSTEENIQNQDIEENNNSKTLETLETPKKPEIHKVDL